MIAMRMGDENGLDRLMLRCSQQGCNMTFIGRAGIDHCEAAFADNISAGSSEGEWPAIGRNETAHAR